jgi:PAS domain S-box-containing protein
MYPETQGKKTWQHYLVATIAFGGALAIQAALKGPDAPAVTSLPAVVLLTVHAGLPLCIVAILLSAYCFEPFTRFRAPAGNLVRHHGTAEVEARLLQRQRTSEAATEPAKVSIRCKEENYALLFENSLDAVFLSDADGTISAANKAACLLFGMTPEEFRQAGRAGLIASEELRLPTYVEKRASAGTVRGELEFVRKDGTTFIGEATSILVDNPALFSFTIIRDISDRKRAEESAAALAATLETCVAERTAELEAVVREQEAFCYSVSHDLRAPLRHINCYSSILAEDFAEELSTQAREYLSRICSSTNKMGKMIDHLLELSRVNRVDLALDPVDLSAMAEQVLRELKETDGKRRCEVVVAESITVLGDRILFMQLMGNLLGNAWKYTSSREDARIEFGMTQIDGEDAFFVRDNGVGFDMAYSSKLFGAFERLHGAEFPGVGIGLATAQRIVRRHGGRIWAKGAVGEGATFYFSLPVYF